MRRGSPSASSSISVNHFGFFSPYKAGNNHPERKTMNAGKRCSIHLISKERRRIHRFCVGYRFIVAVSRIKEKRSNSPLRLRKVEYTWQGNTAPNGIANQTSSDRIADAHQGSFLVHKLHCFDFLESIDFRLFNQSGHSEAPKV